LIDCAPLALGPALFASAQTASLQPTGDGPRLSIAITDVTVIEILASHRRANGPK